jgi:hypothetical protein
VGSDNLFESYVNFPLAYTRVQFPVAPTSGMGAKSSTGELAFAFQVFHH